MTSKRNRPDKDGTLQFASMVALKIEKKMRRFFLFDVLY